MEEPAKSTLSNDLIEHGAIIVIAIVLLGLGYLWWFWAESLLQHFLVIALFALIGGWLRIAEGRNGFLVRLLGLSQIGKTAKPIEGHPTPGSDGGVKDRRSSEPGG